MKRNMQQRLPARIKVRMMRFQGRPLGHRDTLNKNVLRNEVKMIFMLKYERTD